MDFTGSIINIIAFFQDNLLITFAVAILLVFLLFRKPKLFFTVLFIALVLAGVFYIISYVSDVGTSHKKTIIDKKVVPFK